MIYKIKAFKTEQLNTQTKFGHCITKRGISITFFFLLIINTSKLYGQNGFSRVNKSNSIGNFDHQIVILQNESYWVFWTDYRNQSSGSLGDIFAQQFDISITQLGINQQINSTVPRKAQIQPSTATTSKNNIMITWWGRKENSEEANIDQFIELTKLNKNGNKILNEIRVNSDYGNIGKADPDIFVKPDDSYIVTWLDRREGPIFGYAQKFNSTDKKVGTNFRFHPDSLSGKPSIIGFNNGKYIYTLDGKYIRIYSKDDQPLSSWLNLGSKGNLYTYKSDRLLQISFSNSPDMNTNIVLKLFSLDGKIISKTKVNDNSAFIKEHDFTLGIDQANKNIYVAWRDYRNDYTGQPIRSDIYAQKFDSTLSKLGSNFKFNYEITERKQYNPTIKIQNNIIYATWSETQPGDVISCKERLLSSAKTKIYTFAYPIDKYQSGEVRGHYDSPFEQCPDNQAIVISNIFPNPATNYINVNIKLAEALSTTIYIKLYDINGQLLYTEKFKPSFAGLINHRISLKSFSSGKYLLRVKGLQEVEEETIIVIK